MGYPKRLLGLIESSPLPYALNDHDLNITCLNPACVQAFGDSLDEVRTVADWWLLAYPDERHRAWVAQHWAQRKPPSLAHLSAVLNRIPGLD